MGIFRGLHLCTTHYDALISNVQIQCIVWILHLSSMFSIYIWYLIDYLFQMYFDVFWDGVSMVFAGFHGDSTAVQPRQEELNC